MPEIEYQRPTKLDDALALLREAPKPVAILAGGTDLMIKLRAGLFPRGTVIDIKRLPEVQGIVWDADGTVHIGAAVTMAELYRGARLCEQYPALTEGAEAVGSLQIRNRATVVGNLCNASPCMDTAPALLLLDARLRVVGPQGGRELPVRQLFVDVKKTSLAADELSLAVTIPAASKRLRTGFDKIKRVRGHDLALVNCAVAYDAQERSWRAAIGSCGKTTVVTDTVRGEATAAAAAQVGDALAAAALERTSPIDDVRATAEYRRDMTALLVRRLVTRLCTDRGRQS